MGHDADLASLPKLREVNACTQQQLLTSSLGSVGLHPGRPPDHTCTPRGSSLPIALALSLGGPLVGASRNHMTDGYCGRPPEDQLGPKHELAPAHNISTGSEMCYPGRCSHTGPVTGDPTEVPNRCPTAVIDPIDFEDSDWSPCDLLITGVAQPPLETDLEPCDPAISCVAPCAPLAPVPGQAHEHKLLRKAFAIWCHDTNGAYSHDDKVLLLKRVKLARRCSFLTAKINHNLKAHNCVKASTTCSRRPDLQYELVIARSFYFAAWCAFIGKDGGQPNFPKIKKANRRKKK